jgi:DNA-binding transcriptional LysR family regulator
MRRVLGADLDTEVVSPKLATVLDTPSSPSSNFLNDELSRFSLGHYNRSMTSTTEFVLPPITNMNLRLLQTFMVVAETLSFRAAAEQMRRSPSAISVQVRQLEEQLGLKLLYRTTRSVHLTAEGAELFTGTRRAMHEVGLGLRRIHELADVRRGTVSLACSPTVAATQLPRILAVFEKDYPAVRVQLREMHAGELFQAVRQGDVDFGIGPRIATVGDDIHFETVLDDPFMALIHHSQIAKTRVRITLKELARMPLLLQSSALITRHLLEEAEHKSGLKLTSKYECTQVQSLVAMAEAGLGAAIVPRSFIQASHTPSTRALRITQPGITRQVALVTVRGRPFSPASGRLAQLVREMIGR